MTAFLFLSYLFESSLCLLVFYLFYSFYLKRKHSFNMLRAYLLLSSALSLTIPMIEVHIPPVSGIPIVPWEGYFLLRAAEASTEAGNWWAGLLSWQGMLLSVYVTGVAVAMLRFSRQLSSILWLIFRNRKFMVYQGGCYQVPVQGQVATSSFFSFLFWNDTMHTTQEEREQILAHEKVHMDEKHSYDILYFSILKIFYWFHPAAYQYLQETSILHEFAADARVVSCYSLRTYRQVLAKQALLNYYPSVVNHFYQSHILKRMNMMEQKSNFANPFHIVAVLPLLAMAFYIFSCQEEKEVGRQDHLLRQYGEALTKEEKIAMPDADEIFMVVEEQPIPEGGIGAYFDYVKNNLVYPAEAREAGIEGKVFVQFVVDIDGSVSDVKVLKGIGGGCDEAAAQVVRNSPAWNPGLQKGQAVKVRMVLPITFRL